MGANIIYFRIFENFFTVPPLAPHGQHPKLGNLHASMMRIAQAALLAG